MKTALSPNRPAIRRKSTLVGILAAIGIAATGCPTSQPGSGVIYHPEALAAGNRIFIGDYATTTGKILSNPGGTTSYPTEPVALRDVLKDTEMAGNPSNADELSTDANGFHMLDGSGNIRATLGPNVLTCMFSADGSTFALTRYGDTNGVIEIFNTSDMTIRRSIDFPIAVGTPSTFMGWPTLADISHDGSRILVKGYSIANPAADFPLMTTTTSGNDPLVTILPVDGFEKLAYRITGANRVTYFVNTQTGSGGLEMRSVGINGTNSRVLGTFQLSDSQQVAAEIGTGRTLVKVNQPGSSTQTQVIAVEDSAAATQTLIAGPLSQVRLSRLVKQA